MTEDQALKLAKGWVLAPGTTEEKILSLTEVLLVAAQEINARGEPYTDKEVYWLGVKAGVERHSYWCNGARYVGVGATTLHEALAQVDKEMREALAK